MKAVQLIAKRSMSVVDVPDPGPPGPGDVLVRIARVGICGSDVHYYADGKIGSQIVEYPWTVGHEAAGTVLAVGRGVSRVRPGDRIAVDPAMPCHSCDQCLAGRPHTCRNMRFLACPGQVEGCLSEQFVLPEASCLLLPDKMSLEQAALVEPLSVGLYGVVLSPSPRAKKVAVLGAGPIGLCVLMVALNEGAAPAIVTEPIAARRAVARDCGADAVVDSADAELLVSEHGGGVDIVYECCGRQEALDLALELLTPGGTLMLIGIPEENRISFDINLLRRKELQVRSVRRQNGCMQRALDMIASGEVDAGRLVTHRFDLGRTPEAFDLVSRYADGVVKAVVSLD